MNLALIVEDHPLFGNALAELVKSLLGNSPILVSCAESGLDKIRDHPSISMILLDAGLPGMEGVDAICAFRAACPDKPVLVVSGADGICSAKDALESGASGYISKKASMQEISHAIRQVAGLDAGDSTPRLTRRQKEVLGLIVEGHSNKSIGNRLLLSDSTIKMHVSSLFRIFNARSRTQLIFAARRLESFEAGIEQEHSLPLQSTSPRIRLS